ncbi:KdsC family phosphatase [Taibaiella soli]|uniref:3-deoxy-D-manno-octulosonate 8-phosphate phosphatase n=1 Tax=Taibaiella soli TaxID=1649169 RepID=A0A2W2ATD0_9BACT|nr:HAD hydrolase family protein [Taibaiella soli]PZF71224.1 3-deoxy-D-manno-octulosonate 8-phosphate phosphatase [Taibaiella soli]
MNLLELFAPIRAFVFDIDGVLTDGTLLVLEDGHQLRRMNIKDGYALQLAVKKGYQVWVISGGTSEAAQIRLNKLGITEVHIGVKDKKAKLHELAAKYNIELKNALYMGDDIPDYAVMQCCGLPSCPNDAVSEIREKALYISPFNGGFGCVRDVLEKVLKLNGDWDLPV